MNNLWPDIRYALRQLRKSPGFTLIAVLTLALGVGANTAIFTVIENVLLRPLPYAHSNRLIYIGGAGGGNFGTTSWLNYRDIRDQSRLLEQVAGYSEDVSVVETHDTSQSVVAPRVTPNLFTMLDAQPLLGRTFNSADGEPGGPSAAILSEGHAAPELHSDPSIVGCTIRVGGQSHVVVGVMPAAFHFPDEMGPDVGKGIWLPLQPTPEMLKDRGYHFFEIAASMRPGVTLAQAQQELNSIAAHIPLEKDSAPVSFVLLPTRKSSPGRCGRCCMRCLPRWGWCC